MADGPGEPDAGPTRPQAPPPADADRPPLRSAGARTGPEPGARPASSRRDSRNVRRARRVKRIVRRVELWSVLKLSLLFYGCVYLSVLIGGVVLWNLAQGAGLLDDLTGFVAEATANESFELFGDEIFRAAAIAGGVLTVAGALFTTLGAALFNVISELIGGVRFTVLEEEPPRRPSR